jgi:hypothetical protein
VPAGELFGHGERAFQVLLEGQKVPDLGRYGIGASSVTANRSTIASSGAASTSCRANSRTVSLRLINANIDKAADSPFHALMGRAQIQQTALTVKDHRHPFTPVTSADRQLHRFLLLLRHRKVRSMS